MWGSRVPEPDDPELMEIVRRYAARCSTAAEARKGFTECVPLDNNGPAVAGGRGRRQGRHLQRRPGRLRRGRLPEVVPRADRGTVPGPLRRPRAGHGDAV